MARFKNKYEALNYLNEKYDVYWCEVTCYDEAKEFWNNFCALWSTGKVLDDDMKLGEIAIDRF